LGRLCRRAELCDDARMGSRDSRSLVSCAWVVLGLLAAHDVTHVLDDGLETPLGQLAYVALPQWLFLGIAMTVIVYSDPARSRIAALLVGMSVTIGFTVVHLLPFSPADLWQLHPSVISWVLVWLPAVAGLVLAALAWPRQRTTRAAPRRRRSEQPETGSDGQSAASRETR
jgi:hypothetical protein